MSGRRAGDGRCLYSRCAQEVAVDRGRGDRRDLGRLLRRKSNAGGVHVLRGSKSGLTGTNFQWFPRSTVGVPGTPTEYGNFGQLVRLRDIDRGGDKDLLVSSDHYDGGVLLPGTGSGITGTGAEELNVVASFPR